MSIPKQLIFVMIKSDGIRRALSGEIISRFEKKGYVIAAMKMIIPDRKLIEEHYQDHISKGFYDELVNYTISGPVIAMVLIGDVQVARKIVGSTIPWENPPGTIRGDYACSIRENLIHCSDSIESARREVELWFPGIDKIFL